VRIREYGRAMVPARILGGGGTVGSARKLYFNPYISYKIIMRCDPVSYNLIRKVHHGKENVIQIH
jgi:hypothetical protein